MKASEAGIRRRSSGLNLSRPALKYQQAEGYSFAAGVAEMDFGLAQPVRGALLKAVQSGQVGYLDPHLEVALGEACAEWIYRDFGWNVKQHEILIVPDTASAIAQSLIVLRDKISGIVMHEPLYPRLREEALRTGLAVHQVPLISDGQKYTMNIPKVAEAIERVQGRPLLVLCNPHNPTGAVASHEELRELSLLISRRNGFVVSDEVHSPLVRLGFRHVPYASVSPEAASHAITLVSATKGWNFSGLKCAQVIVQSKRLRKHWTDSYGAALLSNSVSRLGAVASVAAFTERSTWRQNVLEALEANVAQLMRGSSDGSVIGVVPPRSSYLTWVSLGRDAPAGIPVAELFARSSVRVAPGSDFGESFASFCRLNIAMEPAQFERLMSAVRAAALSQTNPS